MADKAEFFTAYSMTQFHQNSFLLLLLLLLACASRLAGKCAVSAGSAHAGVSGGSSWFSGCFLWTLGIVDTSRLYTGDGCCCACRPVVIVCLPYTGV